MAYRRGSKSQDKPGKLWHIQAESSDGVVVTTGKYDTEEGAKADYSRIVEEGFYRKVEVVFTPPPEPEEGQQEEEEGKKEKEEKGASDA
ncbi:MAG: hypothetical protein JXQ75_23395 [Phycisphaerae bacterium]|nr:hypothetical protein [Phycisphaerae bacterium]